MTEVLKAGVLSDEIDLGALAHNAAEQAEEFVRKVSIYSFLLSKSFFPHRNQIETIQYIFMPNETYLLGVGSILESLPLSSLTKMASGQ